jgi:glutamate formiminotransferase
VTLECVVNISEGTDDDLLARLAGTCGTALLDLHRDAHHNRGVFTLAGEDDELEEAVRSLTRLAVGAIDLAANTGAHPRLGVVDVVPFVPLVRAVGTAGRLATGAPMTGAVEARDRFAGWAGTELDLPCFLFGPLASGYARALPTVRRGAFGELRPDTGPSRPHPSAGATAVGARGFLVAYNLWVEGGDVAMARAVAIAVRGPAVRALGFDLGGRAQVSCNLIDPGVVGPAEIHDEVAARLGVSGAGVAACELVGLLPATVLDRVPRHRWEELDLVEASTIEAQMEGRPVSWR